MLKKISIAINSVFLLLLFSCSNLFGSYDTSTKLTIGLPSGEYSRQAEGSKSLYYKVTCNPDFSGPSKMEKYGKSGEKIEFNNLTAGNYSIKVEGFQNEKMEMLLYKGEGNATVVAGENTNITIALKYVGPKSETPLGIGDSYIDLTFNEDTGFKVEVHAVENITPKTIYWIYNNFVMDEYTGRYTLTEDAYGEYENPLAVSAVVEFSDGTYSSASATDAVYKDSDVYSFEKQHSYKEMKEETDTGLLNYTLKINKSTETFETDIQVYLMDELLAGDAEPVLMMEKTSGTIHTYTEGLEPGWYFVVSHINCGLIGDFDGNSFSLSQVVKIEQGYECNFGIGVNLLEAGGSGAGSGSGDDSGSGAGDGGSRTFSEVYGDIEVISPVADSFDETCNTTNMASLASTLAGETDKASEKVICIDGSWVAPTSTITISGNVRLVSKTGATIYRCINGTGYENPIFTVSEDATLTIGGEASANITVDGKYNTGTSSCLIRVNGGTFVMEHNSVVQKNYNSSTSASTKGLGTIDLESTTTKEAKFIMNAGELKGNYSKTSAGAIYSNGTSYTNSGNTTYVSAVVELNGGTISGNESLGSGAAVWLNISKLTLNGTEISGNTMKATIDASTTTNPDTGGGAIYMKGNDSSLTLIKGSIKNNKTNTFGGALMLYKGSLIIPSNSNVVFEGNTVENTNAGTGEVSNRGAFLAIGPNDLNVTINGETSTRTMKKTYETYEDFINNTPSNGS